MQFGSLCVQEPADQRTTQPHQLPIYATSSFAFDNLEEGMEVFSGQRAGHLYSRFGNPTIDAVAGKIAALECFGEAYEGAGYLCSSGMGAISTLCLGLLKPGDKILTQRNLYGGTTELFQKMLEPLGLELVLAELDDLAVVERLLNDQPGIRMVYYETPANPTLTCLDIRALSSLAGQHGAYSVADNTFATPDLQRPLQLGADFVLHSTTKYLNGHGNSTSGAIIGKDAERMQEEVFPALKLLGTNCNPWDAWLLNNGMKTLSLRMERHCDNAEAVAQYLSQSPLVSQVHYPGLNSHPQYDLAKRQMRRSGGVVSFELKDGLAAGRRFVNALSLCSIAPTMGDIDTLVMHPASMSHLRVPQEQRLAAGITDGMIRLSVGIEEAVDILADLERGLQAV
ncbi:MAG: aminotransferase class V-fold PLP-dependent enzyme [Bacteroidetes bacterium]|nr:aminotransferase class V-fold PLP-dependent enzyme [Bacteroidota bacterium]